MFWCEPHTSFYLWQLRAYYITLRSRKYHICVSEASNRLPRSLPPCTSVFFVPCTPSFPKSLAVPAFLSVFILSSLPTLPRLPFAIPSIYISLSLSIFSPMHFRLLRPLNPIVPKIHCVTSHHFRVHAFFHHFFYIFFLSPGHLSTVYIFLSIFLLAPSPPKCIRIYSHLTVPLHHYPQLHTSLPLCVRADASRRHTFPLLLNG